MKGFILRLLSILIFACFGSVLLWHYFTHRDPVVIRPNDVNQKPVNSIDVAASDPLKVQQQPAKRNDIVDRLIASYSTSWKKHEQNLQSYRSLLSNKCNAISAAVVTQHNSPTGTNITFDADRKKILEVTPALYNLFPKETPFKNAPWDTCAVVGNGGILTNSNCGKQIDSASYVIRCNLPPLKNGHEKDAGSKSNIVTANPSILNQKYGALNDRRRLFVEDVQLYGNALILLPAFSYRQNTAVSLRALYSLEDFGYDGPQAVFFNPAYLRNLAEFWRRQGLRSMRLSTGIMMASLALELCKNVHLYGFWPFSVHPYTSKRLTNHYYDNKPANNIVHAMSAEFEALLNLHNKGVIHLHIGECTN
ncbi:hypothetical protein KOW79_001408 [Hemibagrus wyckioides]|uniref:Uncharacterized protein n=1 Tax=Hemibagrus wyckioides TaxID=337641 RepID=A0A9D3P5B8_9TELE|nr:alpha-2,8-sialyltransferase 8F-like [Hemibagrus wyckioides]KAG7334812.1 hypothetical protein KOW79_001408 [Hemibagrus wyckioides]